MGEIIHALGEGGLVIERKSFIPQKVMCCSSSKDPDGEGLSPALLRLDSMASQRSFATDRGMVVELKFSSLRR